MRGPSEPQSIHSHLEYCFCDFYFLKEVIWVWDHHCRLNDSSQNNSLIKWCITGCSAKLLFLSSCLRHSFAKGSWALGFMCLNPWKDVHQQENCERLCLSTLSVPCSAAVAQFVALVFTYSCCILLLWLVLKTCVYKTKKMTIKPQRYS